MLILCLSYFITTVKTHYEKLKMMLVKKAVHFNAPLIFIIKIILQKKFQLILECLHGEYVRAGRICKGVSVSTCSIIVVTHPEYHQLCTAAGYLAMLNFKVEL